MNELELAKFVDMFKHECHDHADEIDPEAIHDWSSLTLGWAIGKGMNVETAVEFTNYIRRETDLG